MWQPILNMLAQIAFFSYFSLLCLLKADSLKIEYVRVVRVLTNQIHIQFGKNKVFLKGMIFTLPFRSSSNGEKMSIFFDGVPVIVVASAHRMG